MSEWAMTMTANHATKQAARRYARRNGVTYRQALDIVRRNPDGDNEIADLLRRVLIEAIEGCGIGHWASVQEWDGATSALITDIGGERFRLTPAAIRPAALAYLDDHPDCDAGDVDSYVADEIVQTALFGGLIYRFEARRRATTFHA